MQRRFRNRGNIAERRRINDERNLKSEKVFKDLDSKLAIKSFKEATADNIYEETACSICCEEFTQDAQVRETPCQHLFHGECLMAWVRAKAPTPDCPFCRASLIVI